MRLLRFAQTIGGIALRGQPDAAASDLLTYMAHEHVVFWRERTPDTPLFPATTTHRALALEIVRYVRALGHKRTPRSVVLDVLLANGVWLAREYDDGNGVSQEVPFPRVMAAQGSNTLTVELPDGEKRSLPFD